MEAAEVANLLRDFRSIKLPKGTRAFVDQARKWFESRGSISVETWTRLRQLAVRYSRQMRELHAARERARITNGLRKAGVSKAEAAAIRERRLEEERTRRSDLGI